MTGYADAWHWPAPRAAVDPRSAVDPGVLLG
ncbi:hypothetical protein BH24ACT10_BH24ACT10_14540 [soil metagenome]